MHPKLPDQKNVQHIFKEVHDRDERIELNLYIVNEERGREGDKAEEGSEAE